MMIKSILILTVLAALVPTAMSNVSASAASEIALFSTASSDSNGLSITGNGDSAKMELKATNDEGKSNRVSGFQLTADNVLSTEVGDKATVIDNVDFTKAITTDAKNNQEAVGITSNGVIDITGYAQGVYTLDVVVDDDRAYEAIIAIGDQTNQIVDKEITRVNNDYTLKFVIDFDCDKGYHYENGKCVPDKPKPIKCPEGEELIDGKCVPIPIYCPAHAGGCEPRDEGLEYEGEECVPITDPCEGGPPCPPVDPCIEDPNAEGCIPIDPCEENPDSPECVVDPCEENPDSPECEVTSESLELATLPADEELSEEEQQELDDSEVELDEELGEEESEEDESEDDGQGEESGGEDDEGSEESGGSEGETSE